jgi:glutamate carboxypeptidase
MPVVIEDNRMSGPGVYDMKVGLTQIIFALQAVHDLGIELTHLPLVLITSDEELGSEESVRHIRRLARLVDRVFIPEPSAEPHGKLKTSRKGVGAYQLFLEGKAAHAGVEPEAGVSTVLELPALIEELQALNDPSAGITLNIGTVQAGERLNIVPAQCEIGIDVRVPTSADARHIDESIRQLKPVQDGIRLRIEGGVERPPMERTPRNEALWRLAQSAGRNLGLEIEGTSTGGGSDGNLTSPITATLDGLGGVGGGAHARHEHIFLDKMIERTALLTLLLTLPAAELHSPPGQ